MIEKVLLRDYDDNTAPPERVLEVGLVGDQLFLTVAEYYETNKETKITPLQEVSVSSTALASAILTLDAGQIAADSARNAKK